MKRKLKRTKYILENVYHVDWVVDGCLVLGYGLMAAWYVSLAIEFLG